MCGGVEIWLHSFLNLPIYGGKLPTSCFGRFIPGKSFPGDHPVERGMCPVTGLEALEKTKICFRYNTRRNTWFSSVKYSDSWTSSVIIVAKLQTWRLAKLGLISFEGRLKSDIYPFTVGVLVLKSTLSYPLLTEVFIPEYRVASSCWG